MFLRINREFQRLVEVDRGLEVDHERQIHLSFSGSDCWSCCPGSYVEMAFDVSNIS
jgi:hypothetical protein